MSKVKFFQSWGPYPRWFRRLIIGSIIVGMLIAAGNVFARHLGPVVFGVERSETALVCYTLENAKALAEIDKKYRDQPHEVFIEKWQEWNGGEKCKYGLVTYIATVKSFEYESRYVRGLNEFGTGVWTIFGALTVSEPQTTIYVFVLTSIID